MMSKSYRRFCPTATRCLWTTNAESYCGVFPNDYKLPFACQVFSYNTRREFIRYLTDIRDSVSPEHLKLIEEVYGPDPLKPPTSIYGINRAHNEVA